MLHNHFNLDGLGQFVGSERFIKHWCNKRLVYTEGVQYLASQAKCYWLLNEIGLILLPRLLKKYPDWFYHIEWCVYPDCSGLITIDDGNDNTHFTHKIEWTNYPIKEQPFKFFLCDAGEHYCLMLPSEY
jgi:hypothetical protein